MKRNKQNENEVNKEQNNAGGVNESGDVSEIEKQVVELTNDLKRTRADFENFRKQVELQKENEKKMTKLATVYKVLPLLDDLDRALGTYNELKPLEKSLEKTVAELGLKRIVSEEGTSFDPNIHEAVMTEEGDGENEVVAETLRTGYYYEDEVLRPAMVKVKRVP